MIWGLRMWALVACVDGGGFVTVPRLHSDLGALPHSDDDSGDSAQEPHSALHSGDSAESAVHTGLPPIDLCTLPPPAVGAATFVQLSPLSEEFALDGTGTWLGVVEGQGLFTQTLGGSASLLIPYNSAEAAGLRFRPNGTTLAFADEGGGLIVELDLLTGTALPLLAGLPSPNSIAVDALGDLWIGSYGQLVRLRSGQVQPEVIAELPYTDLDGLTLSPDGQRLWFNGDETGDVWAVDVDAARNVTSVGVVFTAPLSLYTQLDGMTTDTCGNLYYLYTDGQLWRHRTDGTNEQLLGSQFAYASAISFGSGVGGWERDVLYIQDRGSGLYALPIGLEGRPEVHLP
jgi:hypothetical protein